MININKSLTFMLGIAVVQSINQTHLLAKPITQADRATQINNVTITSKRVLSLVAVGAACVGIYKFGPKIYNALKKKIQEKIQAKIDNEIIESVQVICTSNTSIDNLPEPKRTQNFQRKARLVNMRIRVLNKIESLLNAKDNRFSPAHKAQIKKQLEAAQALFLMVDYCRTLFFKENPYEDNYIVPTKLDEMIEANIIESVLLALKPNNECSDQEINKKAEARLRMLRIIDGLNGKMPAIILKKIKNLIESSYLMYEQKLKNI